MTWQIFYWQFQEFCVMYRYLPNGYNNITKNNLKNKHQLFVNIYLINHSGQTLGRYLFVWFGLDVIQKNFPPKVCSNTRQHPLLPHRGAEQGERDVPVGAAPVPRPLRQRRHQVQAHAHHREADHQHPGLPDQVGVEVHQQGALRAAQVPLHPPAGAQGGPQQRPDSVQRVPHLSQGWRLPRSQLCQGDTYVHGR